MVVLWRVNVPPIQSSSTKITNQSWKLIIKSCTVDVFNLIKLKTLPSSSETSKISSTVSGKLIRCFSVVICEEQDKDARERYGGDRGRSGMNGKEREYMENTSEELNLIKTRQSFDWTSESQYVKATSFAYWRNHVNHAWCVAHRGDRLLGNQFQHIDDRDVTQTLSNTQGRCPILCRERWETSCEIFP